MASARNRHVDRIDRALADGANAGDDEAADETVRRSWMRSAKAHIDPTSDRAPHVLTSAEIETLREPAQRCLEVAQGELDRLYRLVHPTRYVILMCDKNGVVMDHRGEESEARQFQYWGTWLGGVWGESEEGTNGIGTAIAEGRPVTVHRSQHFRARHMNLSCSGAPIFDADGKLAAVLDVSSIDPNLSEHAHALTGALTVAFARNVEERLFRDKFRRHWVLAVRIPDEHGGAMLLAIDSDHYIAGADRVGRSALARAGFDAARRIPATAIFEHANALFRKDGFDDRRVQLRAKKLGETWVAIVTPPEPPSAGRLHPDAADLHLRPRLETLLTERNVSVDPAPAFKGGLAPATARRVRDYVDANVDRVIDLKTMASAVDLSTSYFARAFKQSQGVTPHEFVLERRVAKARELLRDPGLSLSEIAARSGFADQSHFTRRFREAMGMTPGDFRKSVD